GAVADARLALCGVGATPYEPAWIAEALIGEQPTEAMLEEVSRRVRREGEPFGDGHAGPEYRRRVAGVLPRPAPSLAAAPGAAGRRGRRRLVNGQLPICLTVNDATVRAEVESRLLLADFLREELELCGTHLGCEHGICGACTVLLDGKPVRSCLMLAVQADG